MRSYARIIHFNTLEELMLSEAEWVKLLPEIRKALEQTKGPATRWGHRRIHGYLIQLVAELEETRRSLGEKGWVHQKDVLEKIRRAIWRLESAASDVEDAACEARDAAADLYPSKPINIGAVGNQEPWGSVSLSELISTIQKHHMEHHTDPFRFCSDQICATARYTA